MGFRRVRLRSLWVLTTRNTGEIRGWKLRVKSRVGTSILYILSFRVIGQVLLKTGRGGVISLRHISAETCNYPTQILISFLSHVQNSVSRLAIDLPQHCRTCFFPKNPFIEQGCQSHYWSFELVIKCRCLSENSRFIVICVSFLLCSSSAMIFQLIIQFTGHKVVFHRFTQHNQNFPKKCFLIPSHSFPKYPKLHHQRPTFFEFNQLLFF